MAADDVLLLIYEYVPDMAVRREPHIGPHREKIAAEREAGRAVAAGPFDPPTGGLLVFRGVDREHVEAFVASDPYNEAGLIASYRVQPWVPLWEPFAT
jgi:uncharacterized protein YciI